MTTWLKYIIETSWNKHRVTIHKIYKWIHSEVTITSTWTTSQTMQRFLLGFVAHIISFCLLYKQMKWRFKYWVLIQWKNLFHFLTSLTRKRNSAQGQFYFLMSLKPRINTAQGDLFHFYTRLKHKIIMLMGTCLILHKIETKNNYA